MKWVRYSKYTGDDLDVDAEDLLRALSDFLLSSGFQNPYMQFSEMNERSLEDLKNAILQALEAGELFDPERAERIRRQLENMSGEELDQMLDRMVEKLVESGYLNTEADPSEGTGPGGVGEAERKVKVEVTDKSIDFLGYKTLKDLLGSLGRSSFGAHDTRDL